jgi:nucleoside-diphosphate-sugar epimerase
LRPRFVVGPGDRHFLPGLVRLAKWRIGIGDGRQASTIVDVCDYAEIILRLAARIARAAEPRHEAFNVGYVEPIRFAELAELVGLRPRLRIPIRAPALARLRRMGGQRLGALAAQLELIGLSHHLDVTALEKVVGRDLVARDPRAAFARALARTMR